MKFEHISVYNFDNALRGMRNPKNSWDKSDSKFGIAHLDDMYDIARDVAHVWADTDGDVDQEIYNNLVDSYTDWLIQNGIIKTDEDYGVYAFIGPGDMKLAKALIRGGSEHRKFLRQIFVSVDITAPLYWFKEFDTYKVGTVANSTSTMHKLTSQPITIDCFETDDQVSLYDVDAEYDFNIPNSWCQGDDSDNYPLDFINYLEDLRVKYLETKDKRYWKELVRWLPESWLQTRTVTMNYENLLAMCSKSQRRFHKLNEWSGSEDDSLNNFISFARKLPYAADFIFLDEAEQE